MDFGIAGKRALVLASTSGLGRAIAGSLAAEGARVAICSRRPEAVAETGRAIHDATGAEVVGNVVDLADMGSVDAMLDSVLEDFGGVDILVNNTGGPPPGPAAGTDDALWRQWFDTMVVSLVHVTGRVLPGMRERGWGRIVTVTSISTQQPVEHLVLSNALRASLNVWNKTLAAEVAEHGITCNIVAPGRIRTPRIDQLDEAQAEREGLTPEEVSEEQEALIPMRREGRAEEFGDVACFLASQRASYVTGVVLRVDGGVVRSL
jgi:3-oxoacyl-[acyl-carrier protein] reductase